MTQDFTEKRIGIIDYGCGNVGSVQNMFSKIEIWSEIIDDSSLLGNFDAIVLPGVGSFDNSVRRLKNTGFWEVIIDMVENGKTPILGICLGMQLFFDSSEEGEEKGFGWIPGVLKKFEKDLGRVPHMGWNVLENTRTNLFDLSKNEFYFVHSYHAPQDLSAEFRLADCHLHPAISRCCCA